MPASFDEQQQFVDSSGAPLVSGKVYIGTQNADPILNPITIFSDRALTVAIANPQILDANGRTTNKIWVTGRYSMRVDNLNDVQQYQELDNGEESASGITGLTNVSGSNTITATAVTTITAYVDKELYTFRAVGANTAGVTLNIDGVGAKAVLKNHDKPIDEGNFGLNQNVIVSFNATDDTFEWVNQNALTVAFYKTGAVVAAATTDVWRSGGNNVPVTGSTGITSFGTPTHIGAVRWVRFTGSPILTHAANLILPGGVDFQASPGDFARLFAETLTQTDVQIFKADGLDVVPRGVLQVVNTETGAVATGTTLITYDDSIPQNTEGDQFMTLNITPKKTTNRLIIEVVAVSSHTVTGAIATAALFQDSIANSLAAVSLENPGTSLPTTMAFRHEMAAGTVSAISFKVRIGSNNAGTTTFNGINGVRRLGGVHASSITITEIAA